MDDFEVRQARAADALRHESAVGHVTGGAGMQVRLRTPRPQMGRVAERRADRIVITNDNPRSESPGAIIDDILKGLVSTDRVTVIEDRAAAIGWAIDRAQPDVQEPGRRDV